MNGKQNWKKRLHMPEKRFVFAVQGEGRGHLTQAIAMFRLLQEQGHEVSCVIVGRNPNRELPDFFLKKITVPIVQVESPSFSMGTTGKSVNLCKTIFRNLASWNHYTKSLAIMRKVMDTYCPDTVINFYEPLMAMYVLRYHRNFNIVSIAHQYIYLHEAFRFPHGFPMQALLLRWYTRFTALGSSRILALSTYQLPASANRSLHICPPLMRHEIFSKQPSEERFVLVYLLNSAFMKDVINWHKKNPEVKLEVFTDNRDVKERHKGSYKIDDSLCFHSLHDEKFLDMMARCSSLVCTAGFESVCEAMYLGKPVMMVPVPGHFEQYCNARDAQKIGAGIHAREFNLDILQERLLTTNAPSMYKTWVNSFGQHLSRVLAHLENPSANATARPVNPSPSP